MRRSRQVLALFVVMSSLSGCARRGERNAPAIGGSPETYQPDVEKKRPAEHRAPPEVAEDVVENAALPFMGLRRAGAVLLSRDQLLGELSRADAICIGERHDDPHDHYAELALIVELAERGTAQGREPGLGLEMFENTFQPALDHFMAGQIDETGLLKQTQWYDRWGIPYGYYRPELNAAREHGMKLLALNARRGLVKKVALSGLDSLDKKELKEVPDLDLDNAQHRATFDRAMRDHPQMKGKPDDVYAAQTLRDETMADRAARFISERHPARQLLILAGEEHCLAPAIPARIRRRVTNADVRGVRPVVAREPEKVRAELEGYDYALVMTPEGS